jgi:hypothetical protein
VNPRAAASSSSSRRRENRGWKRSFTASPAGMDSYPLEVLSGWDRRSPASLNSVEAPRFVPLDVARSSRLHPDSTAFTSSWLYNYVYTPYTHPDGVVVPGGGLLTGTATTENFNPTTIACGNQPGPGALDANSQFGDTIELCSTQPIPTCSSTNTQTLSIAGYQVRTNSLTIANTGLTYTSEGATK